MAKNPVDLSQVEHGISTVLAPDIYFKGELKFKTSLMIKGRITGTIESEGHLVVGPEAQIDATVTAATITNYGQITGNIEAKKTLEMKSGSSQTGDIKAADLIIESGCSVNGQVQMPSNKSEKA